MKAHANQQAGSFAFTQSEHHHNSLVVIDLSISVGHEPIEVFDLDYACFYGHKMLGPSGDTERFRSPPLPRSLEASTPNLEGVIGMGAAAEYLTNTGLREIQTQNHEPGRFSLTAATY
ncbi:MAG: cysteine desulfurase/selenocysteine lyase [Granulosicoccus sp.]|jgi:cysteine desulfurase/selenocysteine lyase